MTTEQLVKTLRYCSTVGMCDGCWLTTIQKEFGAPFCDDMLEAAEAEDVDAKTPVPAAPVKWEAD